MQRRAGSNRCHGPDHYCERSGKRVRQVRHTHGLLGLISSLKDMTNEPMKASTTRGADFSVQTLANFVVAEHEASRLIGSDEMCMCCFKEILLNRFYLLLLY